VGGNSYPGGVVKVNYMMNGGNKSFFCFKCMRRYKLFRFMCMFLGIAVCLLPLFIIDGLMKGDEETGEAEWYILGSLYDLLGISPPALVVSDSSWYVGIPIALLSIVLVFGVGPLLFFMASRQYSFGFSGGTTCLRNLQ
jgi:hypothetical protein